MNIEEIKKFIPRNGERYIIVENGKPLVVLVSFSDYQKNFNPSDNNLSETEAETEKEKTAPLFNKELSKDSSNEESLEENPKKELTLEDLPF